VREEFVPRVRNGVGQILSNQQQKEGNISLRNNLEMRAESGNIIIITSNNNNK